MLRLLAFSLLATLSTASFCGDSAIPYSLEVLEDGQTILGCARPTCFGWAPHGLPETTSATPSFYLINDHSDGFLRAGHTSIPAFGPADPRFYRPRTAICDAIFSSTCAGVNQWVGGIAPQLDVTAAPTALQCCSYEGLLQSEDRGQASLRGGQIVVGGEVSSSGRQVAFDYVADVAKIVATDGTVHYDVSIRRMPCADVPEVVDSSVVNAFTGVEAFKGLNGQWCFTGDMTVRLLDGTTKRMDELKKQDWVLAMNEHQLEYVAVEFWLHRIPTQEAEFNEFETEDGRTIKLTDKHYIFKGDCSQVGMGAVAVGSLPKEAVFADQVHAGDCLFTIEDNYMMHEVRVVRTGKVTQTGIYAPMTSNGRIFVNGIHASCYNIMRENSVGQTVFDTANKFHNSLFGSSSEEVVETPSALNTILAMAELIIPKHLIFL